jgi:hypothetical protein
MYSQLSMVRQPTTNDCKPQGTHKTLGLVSIIYEMNSMEGESLKVEFLIIKHKVQSRSFIIWWKLDEEHVPEETTLCVFHACQVQVVHKKYPLNRSQCEKLLKKGRKPPIRLMASRTLHESQCLNRCLAVKHKGNYPVNDQ